MALTGLPNSAFEAEPLHEGQTKTVGELAEAYVTNTTSLKKANNKLHTICVAAARCKDTGSDEE